MTVIIIINIIIIIVGSPSRSFEAGFQFPGSWGALSPGHVRLSYPESGRF